MKVTLLPALDGDCILLQFDSPQKNIVIDIGRIPALEALSRMDALSNIDLLVLTHVDADHISGALQLGSYVLFERVKAVWFNAHLQLQMAQKMIGIEGFGPLQGEELSKMIKDAGWPWNTGFKEGVVGVPVGSFFVDHHQMGATFRLISPTMHQLAKLEPIWSQEVGKAGLVPGVTCAGSVNVDVEAFGAFSNDVEQLAAAPERIDRTIPNGSSIAFVFEFGEKRLLLASDAHPDRLEEALRAASANGKPVKIDLFKVSHHGSKANTTKGLLEAIACTRFAFSSDGSRHHHPDPEVIAKILKFCSPGTKKTFYFNYRSPQTVLWEDERLMEHYNYECVFPSSQGGLVEILI